MAVVITGSNTPTAGGVTYGDGTTYATTTAGTSGQVLTSAGAGAPAWTAQSALSVGSATTATSATSATTATNLAGGSNGTIPYQSASGTTQMLAAGTSGYVLQSNGAAAPSWVTPAGGSWVYLSTVTASGSATADIETTFNSTYDMYVIVAENVLMATDGVTLQAGMKIGGTYLTTATYNWWAARGTSTSPTTASSGSTGDTRIYLQGNMANTAATTSAFTAYIAAPSSTSAIKTMYVSGIASISGGPSAIINASGSNSGTAALTGIRFYGSAGNISGKFRLYGIKNS
jgi:hypothetical protein